MIKHFEHIFFDLDHTLWDFERNSHETLQELYEEYQLVDAIKVDTDTFITKYKEINNMYWEQYRTGYIEKEELRVVRFRKTLEAFGLIDYKVADDMGFRYVEVCPTKPNLFPDTIPVLQELAEGCQLHIITNGFEEVQVIKMASSGISEYFDVFMTSERATVKKPSPEIFELAMEEASARPENSVMIGDNWEVDVLGAKSVGMEGVLFDPTERESPPESIRVKELVELTK